MNNSITFIGGPLDLTRQTFVGTMPPYWRVAQVPKTGPLFVKPERPGLLPACPSFDYEILPLSTRGGGRLYVGLPMRMEGLDG